MRTKQLFTIALTLGLIQPFVSQADDLFRMSWRGTVYTTGENGKVVAKAFTEKDFVNRIAVNNGLDPKTLVFVYRPQKHDTAVVVAATGQFVGDVIQMEYSYTEVSDTTQTRIVRQAFIFDEEHSGAIGSAFGTETIRWGSEGALLSSSFRGNFQYAIPEEHAVYSGRFSTGTRVRDLSGS